MSQIVGNTHFGEIDTLRSQGRDTGYLARHYHMDLTLARPPCMNSSRWRADLEEYHSVLCSTKKIFRFYPKKCIFNVDTS